ncbi:AAA family ATPase [Cryptosporangium arvum]|uniref:AAA family ATPase n=1 Tax=Cryptosporangium arvum TaxID=80871 RepID=UPI00055AA729
MRPMSVLVVLRGNSGSGKSTVARELRRRHGRGCALVDQDYLRRTVLREHDVAGGLAPTLVAATARLALTHGYSVVLEGILTAERYREELVALAAGHSGRSTFFWFDVSLPETLRRHATRPLAATVGPDALTSWYLESDRLGAPDEHVIAEASTLDETVAFVAERSGLPQDGRTEDYLPFARTRPDS